MARLFVKTVMINRQKELSYKVLTNDSLSTVFEEPLKFVFMVDDEGQSVLSTESNIIYK